MKIVPVSRHGKSLCAVVFAVAVTLNSLTTALVPTSVASPVEDAPAQTFTVTTTSDGTGAGTLRTAITSANANPGLDTIAFNIAGAGVQTISLGSALPTITDAIVIDGSTQPGYAGEPLIRLGASAGGIPSVIDITAGGSTVRALTFNFFSGVTVGNAVIRLASNDNVIVACAGGSGNSQVLIDGSSNNRIGGSTPADRNTWYNITSNRDVVIVRGATATGNRIVGNWFGTTPAGVRQVNAGRNIFVENAPNNFVGGTVGTTPGGACTGECNLISGTDNDGLTISGATATGNRVVGNFVGLTPDGLDGNRNGNYGVHIFGASNNIIGGTTPAERNVIAANFFGSVFVEGTSTGNVVTGNYVGLKTTGAEAITGTFNVPAFGIRIDSNGNRVGGVTAGERNIISGSNRGIIINGASNLVQGNYIGTDATGSFALTTVFDGVLIQGANNTIGGTEGTTLGGECTGACNLISGNGRNGFNHGLVISGANATGNVVDGNYIGLNASGTAAIRNGTPPSGNAVLIFSAAGNTIGRTIVTDTMRRQPRSTRHSSDLPPVHCIQDPVRGDYVRFDRGTGEYTGKNCFTGSTFGSPPLGVDVDFPPSGFRFIARPYFVAGADTARLVGWFVRGQGEAQNGDLIAGGDCSCPMEGRQTIVGTLELTGANGGDDNEISGNLFNTSANGEADLSMASDINVLLTAGDGNLVSENEFTNKGQSNISIVAGVDNTIAQNTFLGVVGTKPISNGNLTFPILNFKNEQNGNVRVTGSVTNAAPDQRLLLSVHAVENEFRNDLFSYQASRAGFKREVTTNAGGSATINELLTGVDAQVLKYAKYAVATTTIVNPNDTLGATSEFSLPVHIPKPAYDYDDDGRSDVGVVRPGASANAASFWFILNSSNNAPLIVQFGNGEDQPVPGDYNGDLRPDFSVRRPSNNSFYYSKILGDPTTNFVGAQWGQTGDIPVVGDFDGDRMIDPAVYRSGTWFVLQSLTGTPLVQPFGLPTDKVVPADYDGDGRDDIAVYRNGLWYITPCPACALRVENFGLTTDVPVPGDFDGDGKADIAVWRPSTGIWYIQRSTAGFTAVQFGVAGDKVLNGDFDADGKNDVAVWRPSNGIWYILRSEAGFYAIQWGQNGDIPVPMFPNQP